MIRRWGAFVFMVCLGGLLCPPAQAAETRSIAGEWRVARDPGRGGERERWFAGDLPGAATVSLPGAVGEDQATVPTWLQYSLMIPGSWKGKRVSLVLERVPGVSRAWVDGHELAGVQDSLVSPHIHDLGPLGSPATRRLTLLLNAPSIPVKEPGRPGLFGALAIQGVDPISIEDVQVIPDLARRLIQVRVRLANTTGTVANARLLLTIRKRPGAEAQVRDESDHRLGEHLEVVRIVDPGPQASAWSPSERTLSLLNVSVTASEDGRSQGDERAVRFGLRDIDGDSSGITINGQRLALSESLSSSEWKRADAWPQSAGDWRRYFRGLVARGKNSMRFDSGFPSEAAFVAADQEGLLLQVQAFQSLALTRSGAATADFVAREEARILRHYGNHPSFAVFRLDHPENSSGGPPSRRVGELRERDPRHVYRGAETGRP